MTTIRSDKERTPSFYAIIPADVRYCKDLEPAAKLLYGEITALTQREGYCWASNKYFADLYDVCERTVTNWLISLQTCGFIDIETEKDGLKWDRKIWISQKMFTKGKKLPDQNTEVNSKENAPTDTFQRTEKNFLIEGKKTSTDVLHNKNIKEQQQQDVVVFPNEWELQDVEKENLIREFGNELEKLEIAILETERKRAEGKIQIAPSAYLRGILRNCKGKDITIQEKAEDREEKNKAYAMRYDNMFNSTSRVIACNKYVEIANNGMNGSTVISYDENGFMEKFTNALAHNKLKFLE